MARYIDADELCENLTLMAKYQEPYKQDTILGVVQTIKNTKTADVRDVVECCNCGYSYVSSQGNRFCSRNKRHDFVLNDHFCSYGERKKV